MTTKIRWHDDTKPSTTMRSLRLALLAALSSASCSPDATPAASKGRTPPPSPSPTTTTSLPASPSPTTSPSSATSPTTSPTSPTSPARGRELRRAGRWGAIAGRGPAAIAAWDALSPGERERVKSVPTLFLHQSVGQDLRGRRKSARLPLRILRSGPGDDRRGTQRGDLRERGRRQQRQSDGQARGLARACREASIIAGRGDEVRLRRRAPRHPRGR